MRAAVFQQDTWREIPKVAGQGWPCAMAPADSLMLRSRNRSGGIFLPVRINPETGTRLAPNQGPAE
jgi:hypothetical protein